MPLPRPLRDLGLSEASKGPFKGIYEGFRLFLRDPLKESIRALGVYGSGLGGFRL